MKRDFNQKFGKKKKQNKMFRFYFLNEPVRKKIKCIRPGFTVPKTFFIS